MASPGPDKGQSRYASVRAIEDKTRRKLCMQAALTDKTLAKCNPQIKSPLYHKLPKEIRDLIFAYATAPWEDQTQKYKYKDTAYYYRPGHTGPHRRDTNLLLTCRRVWLETSALPMQQAEHTFWFQRGPLDAYPDVHWARNVEFERHRYNDFFNELNVRNMCNVSHVHFFLQMHQTENLLADLSQYYFSPQLIAKGFRPKTFHITIRHSDWRMWERDDPLSLDERWVQGALDAAELRGCEQFRLELETLERKNDQLQTVVDRLMRLEGRPRASEVTKTDDPSAQTAAATKFVMRDHPGVWHWTGPARLDDQDREVYAGIETLRYRVVVLTWRSVKCSLEEAEARKATEPPVPGPSRPHPFAPFRRVHYINRRVPRFSLQDQERRVYRQAAAQADAVEGVRREVFLRLMGDIEARRLVAEWERKGTLLEFQN